MSPLQIEILLWYHCRGEDHPEAENPSPAQTEIFKDFLERGFLRRGTPEADQLIYYPTAKLKAYVAAVCAVPEPVIAWRVGDAIINVGD